MKQSEKQTNARHLFCLNPACSARGKQGESNLVKYGSKRPRYQCKVCGKVFSAKAGTMYEGLRSPEWLITVVMALMAFGCPLQAIVQAFGLDDQGHAHGGGDGQGHGDLQRCRIRHDSIDQADHAHSHQLKSAVTSVHRYSQPCASPRQLHRLAA